jgi:hypothetical protein
MLEEGNDTQTALVETSDWPLFKASTAAPADTSQKVDNIVSDGNRTTDTTTVVPDFNWDDFNKKTEGDFKSFDDIKNLRKKHQEVEGKLKEYEPKIEELKTTSQKLKEYQDALAEHGDVIKKHFGGNANLYVENQLKIKYPDKISVVGKLMGIDKANALDVLITAKKFDNPNAGEGAIKERLQRKYPDLDLNAKPEDWDNEGARLELEEDADVERKRLLGIVSEIKTPEATDYEKQKQINAEKSTIEQQKNVDQWNGFVKNTSFDNVLTSIKYSKEIDKDGKKESKVLYDFKVPEDVQKRLPETVMSIATNANIPLTQENYVQILDFIQNQWKLTYASDAMDAAIKSEMAKYEVEMDKKYNVKREPNRTDGTAQGTKIKRWMDE